ncbi:MAG: DoxX family protein [Kiritimatiellaeota bacterium]|nr:DoxX family protein [Kiritimatiellota bacterium]
MNTRWLSPLSRWIVGLVFLAACLPKLAAPQALALAIFRYHLLPHGMVNAAAILLPWLELTAAVALLLAPAYRRAAARLLLGLLAAFTAAIALDLHRGLDIACGCFSLAPGVGRAGAGSLLRNAVLMTLAALAIWTPAGKKPCPC